MDNLKACPFCGSEAAIENDGLYRWAECQNERCRAMSHAFAFLVDAGNGDAIVVANWNTRPLEDAALKRAEAAEARAETTEAELARLKVLLIAWNLEPDGTYNQPAYWALCSEASKLAWEAHEALKGGEK